MSKTFMLYKKFRKINGKIGVVTMMECTFKECEKCEKHWFNGIGLEMCDKDWDCLEKKEMAPSKDLSN